MKRTAPLVILACFAAVLLAGCAARVTHPDAPLRSSLEGKRVVVFPFQDPYYKGRQIPGVGVPFSTVFISKLQSAGVLAEAQKENAFLSQDPIDVSKACKYASDNRHDAFIIGVVTEWIDGATQWSGTVDVAALSVTVYRSLICEPIGSASGRENGQWFTFINAPTTRFMEPLSEAIVSALLNKAPLR